LYRTTKAASRTTTTTHAIVNSRRLLLLRAKIINTSVRPKRRAPPPRQSNDRHDAGPAEPPAAGVVPTGEGVTITDVGFTTSVEAVGGKDTLIE
jgi:hypothetical protein